MRFGPHRRDVYADNNNDNNNCKYYMCACWARALKYITHQVLYTYILYNITYIYLRYIHTHTYGFNGSEKDMIDS